MSHSKPDPDVFRAAQKKVGIDPRSIIAVGDTEYDAQSAGKAGLSTIGLLCGGSSPAKLKAAGCIALYRDPADLLKTMTHLRSRGLARDLDRSTTTRRNQ